MSKIQEAILKKFPDFDALRVGLMYIGASELLELAMKEEDCTHEGEPAISIRKLKEILGVKNESN